MFLAGNGVTMNAVICRVMVEGRDPSVVGALTSGEESDGVVSALESVIRCN